MSIYRRLYPFTGVWICGAGEIPMLAQIKDAGFMGFRDDVAWNRTELTRGVYNYTVLDSRVNLAESSGLRLWAVLGGQNSLYGGAPDDSISRSAWLKYIVAVVKRHKKKGIVWELYNEPNEPTFWAPTSAGAYATMVQQSVQAIRSVSPDEIIIAGGTSTIMDGFDGDVIDPYIYTAVRSGLDVDFLMPHGYSHYYTLLENNMQFYTETVRNLGNCSAVGVGEVGHSHGWLGLNEGDPTFEATQEDAYRYTIRTCKNNGWPVALYNIQDPPNTTLNTYGMFDANGNAKPLLEACAWEIAP